MTPDVLTGYPVLSGETLVVPILGDPIAQVKSARRGHPRVRRPVAATPSSSRCTWLPDRPRHGRRAASARSCSIGGLIATVPHKFGLVAHCASLTDRARVPRLGQRRPAQSRRLLARRSGRRRGVRQRGCRVAGALPEGARALQVGAGGAGSAIALALLEAGVAELTLYDADPERRDALIGRLRERFGDRVRTGTRRPGRVRTRRQRHPDGDARGATRCPSTSTA